MVKLQIVCKKTNLKVCYLTYTVYGQPTPLTEKIEISLNGSPKLFKCFDNFYFRKLTN